METRTQKKKKSSENRIVEDFAIVESAETLECFDLARTSNLFKQRYMVLNSPYKTIKKRKHLL